MPHAQFDVPDDLPLDIFEDDGQDPSSTVPAWRVLVVDDDEDVHRATTFALRDAIVLGRPIEIVSARSAADGLQTVAREPEFAVALIDVVMDTPDAGLRLVRSLREAGHTEVRLILRTGYPGYAPELSVITDYEIDDYRTKDELTRTRLISVLTASIRAYEQIHTIARSRAGLEMIIESSKRVFQRTNLERFSEGVLVQIGALLRLKPSGLVCTDSISQGHRSEMLVISATGHFAPLIGQPLVALDREIVALIAAARQQEEPVFSNGYMALYFTTESGHELSAVLETHSVLEPADMDLLRMFASNIAIAFENVALVEKLDHLAYSDPVLELPNMNAFGKALSESLATTTRQRLALTEVGSFHSMLALYGPEVANQLLRKIYHELLAHAGEETVIALVDSATFGLLGDQDQVTPELITTTFSRPYRVDDIEIAPVPTSAIIDLEERCGRNPSSILRKAASVLVHIQQTRAGESLLYDAALQQEAERQAKILSALKSCAATGEGFDIVLQPKIELSSGDVLGAEALLRWTREGEPISPAEFIPIAETAGLTRPLTDLVFTRVAGWLRHRPSKLPVAINLSVADLNTPDFAGWIINRTAELNLSPDLIELEVTEGIAVRDAPWAAEQVRALKAAGFRIALDDFGTGYSSLSQFDELPVDTLKIDRSFVSGLDTASARESLAATIVAMTTTLKVDCVAEGIETEEQKQALLFLGCRIGQGYLLGRPMPAETFDAQFG